MSISNQSIVNQNYFENDIDTMPLAQAAPVVYLLVYPL